MQTLNHPGRTGLGELPGRCRASVFDTLFGDAEHMAINQSLLTNLELIDRPSFPAAGPRILDPDLRHVRRQLHSR